VSSASGAGQGWRAWLASDAPGSARQARLGEIYRFGRALARHPLALTGLAIILLLVLVAALAPLLAPYPPSAQHLADRLQSPGARHWLGTDELGRDILSRPIYRTRITLGIVALLTKPLDIDGFVAADGRPFDLKGAALRSRAELNVLNTHDGELAAYLAYASAYPSAFLALVDTYDTVRSGLPNFLVVALALHEAGVSAPELPDSDLLVLDNPAPESTVDEARRAADLLAGRGFRSALLVTDAFHSRRALMLFRAAFAHRGLTVRSTPATDTLGLGQWWAHPVAARRVVEEWTKLALYLVEGAYW